MGWTKEGEQIDDGGTSEREATKDHQGGGFGCGIAAESQEKARGGRSQWQRDNSTKSTGESKKIQEKAS